MARRSSSCQAPNPRGDGIPILPPRPPTTPRSVPDMAGHDGSLEVVFLDAFPHAPHVPGPGAAAAAAWDGMAGMQTVHWIPYERLPLPR